MTRFCFGYSPRSPSRVIPADEWPSATELGAVEYLETRASTIHRHYWADVLRPGLAALNAEAISRSRSSFDRMGTEQQDRLLSDVEQGALPDWPLRAADFFSVVVRLITEAYYVDPGNGGDPAKRSWDMIGYR